MVFDTNNYTKMNDDFSLETPKKLTFLRTGYFDKWLNKLKNRAAKDVILNRIDQVEITGNFGNWKSVNDGVYEMKINFGTGWRIYYAQEGNLIYWLLNGGDKSTQELDIKTAKALWKLIKQSNNKKRGSKNE